MSGFSKLRQGVSYKAKNWHAWSYEQYFLKHRFLDIYQCVFKLSLCYPYCVCVLNIRCSFTLELYIYLKWKQFDNPWLRCTFLFSMKLKEQSEEKWNHSLNSWNKVYHFADKLHLMDYKGCVYEYQGSQNPEFLFLYKKQDNYFSVSYVLFCSKPSKTWLSLRRFDISN